MLGRCSHARWFVPAVTRLVITCLVVCGLARPLAAQGSFVRGDCNTDDSINLADAISLLSGLFSGGFAPTCVDACDVNDDGAHDVGDAVALLSHLFSSGADPAAPFPACGPDPTPDALGCLQYLSCPIEPTDPPISLSLGGMVSPLTSVQLHTLATVDVAALQAEDEAMAMLMNIPPTRIGFNLKTDFDLGNSGTLETLADGSLLWRLRVRSAGALWIGVGFGTCLLPSGAKLWVYDEALTQLEPSLPPISPVHGQRWRYPIAGDTAVVEIHYSATAGEPDVHLGTVLHGYEPPLGDDDCPEDCSPDVTCGDFGIEDINRGVMRMYMPIDFVDCDTTGLAMCSGSLVNNTAQNCRQYVLTASHCVPNPGLAGGASFLFNYERPECCAGVAPDTDVVYGATFRASWPGGFTDPPCFPSDPGGNDVALVEIDEDIPAAFNARYNGWSRALNTNDEVGSVHQPAGAQSKKVAVNFDGYDIVNNRRLAIPEWDIGGIKSGSSGSPLFSEDARIIGVVSTGGPDSDCPTVNTGFGRFDAAWTGGGSAATRLRDWLDPASSDNISIPGREDVVNCDVPPYAGNLQAPGGGAPFPGGTTSMTLALTNGGDLPMSGVQGVLTTTTPGVTVDTGLVQWPDLLGHETAMSLAPLTYSLDATVACGSEIIFVVEVLSLDGDGPWFPEIRVRVGSASTTTVPVGSFYLSDSLVGANAWTIDSTDDTPAGLRYFISDVPVASDTALLAFGVSIPEHSRLQFRQRMDCENIYGGGVFELSVLDSAGGSGPWIDAAPWMRQGGYNSGMAWTVPTDLRNRAAYSGDTGEWQDVDVDLSEFAGQFVQFRWRFVTDDSGGDIGWWIDDAVLETTTYDCVID